MKAINLNTLIDAYKHLSEETFSSYLDLYGITLAKKGNNNGLKKHELEALEAFVGQFKKTICLPRLLDGFFVGYRIPQIPKEFDLLRINNDSIVNIELKSETDEAKVLKQLQRSAYYLKFLNKEAMLFAYVQKSNALYKLEGKDNIVATNFDELSEVLDKEGIEVENLDKLFNPSNYLVSPFNSTKQFMEGEYFLTTQQEDIKKQILKAIASPNAKFIALTGGAGTGKTLLTYDIAKELKKNEQKVLIVHCAQLNNGQHMLQEQYGWDIRMARSLNGISFSEFDVVIVDEAQRLRQEQLSVLQEAIAQHDKKCIFSYDKKQYLHDDEKKFDALSKISTVLTCEAFKLTDKIRTNKEIASFIQLLFNQRKLIERSELLNIELYYCSTEAEVIRLSMYLQENGWKVLKYTPGTRTSFEYEKYGIANGDSAHAVIGQEFDKVVAVIDKTFGYDSDGQLMANNKYYSQRQMLYQILTRTRQKLSIIILDNEPMLKRCLDILGGKVKACSETHQQG